jgi:hypothetical protein
MTPYQDVICGALYDQRGLAFILFTRHREEIAFRTMAQTPNQLVLAVDNSGVKGLIFRKFVVTLTDPSGRSFEFVPIDFRDVCEGSVIAFLNLAWEGNTLLAGHQFTPDDFWTPLSESKTTDALIQFARR